MATTTPFQHDPLSIHALASPLLPNPSNPSPQSPTDLSAELAHYKDLFSKLRFSYTEQVTKERFLRSVVASPPELISADEIAALETKLVLDKASLKGKKAEVAALLSELEAGARGVSRRVQEVERREGRAGEVAREVDELERRREELRGRLKGGEEEEVGGKMMMMGLDETREALGMKMEEAEMQGARIEELQRAVEGRREDVERMRAELEGVEERKREAVREAMEMRRRRGSGVDEGMDEVEAKGRWARASESVLRAVS
ncbi:hypothetical protein CAC42_7416 [Sphaceloma murrayae]|uniref:Kinetochore protein Sos7 coiled-coil domain-containing protein n=1 Tax=Sphaceloma murrayae TaxID=2082308 RepID=A0A2K1QWY8_9PEZI|nr:hypothetical protein CAC42_7416 [Sphaceloma murrayae]